MLNKKNYLGNKIKLKYFHILFYSSYYLGMVNNLKFVKRQICVLKIRNTDG